MSTSPMPENKTLRMALALAEAGYLVFPCLPDAKTPATRNGFKDATTDPDTIRTWFDNDLGYNLAIACGPQPNGINLFVIDVDPKNGGDQTWTDLCARHGTPLAPRHDTPSGGFHLFFDAPAGVGQISRGKLGSGIDIRAKGGYVVAPPSHLVNGRYRSTPTEALLYNAPPALPLWIIQALEPVDVGGVELPRGDAAGDDDKIMDWFRNQGWPFDVFLGELLSDGWTVHHTSTEGVHLTRPDKNRAEGSSALLHFDGNLVIFSTNAPEELQEPLRRRQINRDGSLSWSAWDYFTAVRCGRSYSRASTLALAMAGREDPAAGSKTGSPSVDATTLCLPREFYDRRPWLTMCRQKAEAVGGSPGAHMIAYLTRWATLIPPGYLIPPINGAESSFDLLGVIAGTSGAGKSSPMTNARTLLPFPDAKTKEVPGLGSGEGIIERYYGMIEREGDDGKKRQVRGRAVFGCHFSISEGIIFAELGARAGTNHISRLCDAWSGVPLATPNASAETFREVAAGQYRLTAVLGIQDTMAHELMTDSMTARGFVGRLLFVWTEEPRVKPRPPHPEPVDLPIPSSYTFPGTRDRPWPLYQPYLLTYPEAIWTECQDLSDARVGTGVPVEQHHHDLLRLKVAGVLALMEGRTTVEDDDWSIATAIVEASARVREHLYAIKRSSDARKRHTSAELAAESEIIKDSVKERQTISKLADKIRRYLKEHGPMSRNELRKAVCSSRTKHRFVSAIDLALSNGWVTEEDGRLVAA